MAWLEITINTCQADVESVCAGLTARGFSDLCIEDQQEFEAFLEDNRAYWEYIDEQLEKRLQGLSRVKLYLEDTDTEGLSRVKAFAAEQQLPVIENRCPADKHTKREEIKDLIFDLVKTYPDLKERIFGAMQRYPLPAWEPQGRYKRPKEQE